MNIELFDIVKILGLIFFAMNVWFILRVRKESGKDLTPNLRWLVFGGFVIMPLLILFLGNYHVFERSKKSESCQNCHVMKPIYNDMLNPESGTVAARHYKNRWLGENACYSCHTDYGFGGGLKAKMDGYRHLMRYITGTYTEPIRYRGEFNNKNCLNCHSDSRDFQQVDTHQPILAEFEANQISCLNCHGRAHPASSQRTPGHPDYDSLMNLSTGWVHPDIHLQDLSYRPAFPVDSVTGFILQLPPK